jgi:MFS transporter, DHA1 family, multidrug resistance protein
MAELFRDTLAGQLLRLATGRRVLKYPEEIDPSVCDRYLNKEKSANMALHGQTSRPEQPPKKTEDSSSEPTSPLKEKEEPERTPYYDSVAPFDDKRLDGAEGTDPAQRTTSHSSVSSAATARDNADSANKDHNGDLVNTLSNTRIDPEKGRDADIVDWYGPNDPENP